MTRRLPYLTFTLPYVTLTRNTSQGTDVFGGMSGGRGANVRSPEAT